MSLGNLHDILALTLTATGTLSQSFKPHFASLKYRHLSPEVVARIK
jgi:hypothetical protein